MARPADHHFLVGSWKMGEIAYVYDWQERSYEPPECHPGQQAYTFLIHRRLSSQFQFSLSAVTLGYLSQWYYLGPCFPCHPHQWKDGKSVQSLVYQIDCRWSQAQKISPLVFLGRVALASALYLFGKETYYSLRRVTCVFLTVCSKAN